uniref:Uncharacterized protein n=1 Tax=Fagus sylvatica TaxID=28930 RepID=A0A2N9GAQ2_FAGSY
MIWSSKQDCVEHLLCSVGVGFCGGAGCCSGVGCCGAGCCGGVGCCGRASCCAGAGPTEALPVATSSAISYGPLESREGLYDVPEETLDELASSTTTEGGRRDVDGTPDIPANLVSFQTLILKKALPTDGVNWRNLK